LNFSELTEELNSD